MSERRSAFSRLRCFLLGCYLPYEDLGQQACERCGVYCEDPEFYACSLWQGFRWRWLCRARLVLAGFPIKRCCHCRRWMFGRDIACSEECLRDWIPF